MEFVLLFFFRSLCHSVAHDGALEGIFVGLSEGNFEGVLDGMLDGMLDSNVGDVILHHYCSVFFNFDYGSLIF